MSYATLANKETFFPYYRQARGNGLWDVWHSNPFKTPYVVTTFSTEAEALAHVRHLNALYRAESDAKIAARIQAEMNAPSWLQRLRTFLGWNG